MTVSSKSRPEIDALPLETEAVRDSQTVNIIIKKTT